MTDPLTAGDLFAAGVAVDVVGAYLLGRGLLSSPAVIARRAGPRWNGWAADVVTRSEDRVDATAGIAALLVGLLFQGGGYVASLAGASGSKGWPEAFVALGFGFVAGIATLEVAKRSRSRRLKRFLVTMARLGERGEVSARPSARRLFQFGMELDVPATKAEVAPGGMRAYVARVFGVSAIAEDVNPEAWAGEFGRGNPGPAATASGEPQ